VALFVSISRQDAQRLCRINNMSDLLIPPQKSPGVITPTVTYTAPPVNPDAVALTGTQIVVLANWDNRRSNEAGIADQIRLSIGSANSLFVVNGVTVVALTQATSTKRCSQYCGQGVCHHANRGADVWFYKPRL